MTDSLDRRTKVYKDLVAIQPPIGDATSIEIDGEVYGYKPEPRCHVCAADMKGYKNGNQAKELVDTLLLYPKSFAEVLRIVEPLMEGWPEKAKITYRSIKTHMDKHLPWDRLAFRMIAERRAKEQNISVLDAAGRMMLTEEAWNDAVVHRGWKALVDDQMEIKVQDVMSAWKRKTELLQQAEGEYSVAYMMAEVDVVIQVIREEVPPENWARIEARLEAFKRGELPATVDVEEEEDDDLFQRIIGDDENR